MAKFTVTFNEKECKGCELCVVSCPKKIIALNMEITNDAGYSPASIKDMDSCIGCASCARMCPDCVITIVKND
ncbi:4Fe-4S binding protein [Anaerotignum faecicola]|nr:4Fe-4S binding protein [Anaerotignum faecicola]